LPGRVAAIQTVPGHGNARLAVSLSLFPLGRSSICLPAPLACDILPQSMYHPVECINDNNGTVLRESLTSLQRILKKISKALWHRTKMRFTN
jgi:hypothetical protein